MLLQARPTEKPCCEKQNPLRLLSPIPLYHKTFSSWGRVGQRGSYFFLFKAVILIKFIRKSTNFLSMFSTLIFTMPPLLEMRTVELSLDKEDRQLVDIHNAVSGFFA